MDEEDLDPIELQSFPLLRSCFDEIDQDLGFLIEVKYPMEYKVSSVNFLLTANCMCFQNFVCVYQLHVEHENTC